MTRFRFVATDLDGTLLDPTGAITPRTRAAIHSLRDAGITLVLATSRRLTGVLPVAEAIALDGYLILYDGAQIRTYPGDAILAEEPLALPVARQAAETIAAFGLRPIVQYATTAGELLRIAPEHYGDGAEREYLERFFRQITVVPLADLCPDGRHGLLRIVVFGPLERLQQAASQLADLPCGLQLLSLGNYGTSELSIFSPSASKGHALTTLATRLSIPMEQVFAIGDGINDVSMLLTAGLGIAMANSEKATRAVAHAITASNVEDGAARAIERYVLQIDD
ncbi:MAG: HAD family hydrolase [Ktedonobacterales bacterium]